PTSSNWRAHLQAPQYWDKLSELVAQERLVVRLHSPQAAQPLVRLRAELSEMEGSAKAKVHLHAGSVLQRVRKNLPAGAALLSFRVDKRASWLWAVNQGELQLVQLPPKAALMPEIQSFQDSIRDHDVDAIAKSGGLLYAHLFGGLDAGFTQAHQWF